MPRLVNPIPKEVRDLPRLIKKYREDAGYSRRELERRAHISSGQLSRIESGTVTDAISASMVVRIAHALRLPVGVLFGENRLEFEITDPEAIRHLKSLARKSTKLPAK